MRRLPRLNLDAVSLRLPMSDTSARALLQGATADVDGSIWRRAVDTLTSDPCFLLWAIGSARRTGLPPADSPRDVLARLLRRVPDEVQWTAQEASQFSTVDEHETTIWRQSLGRFFAAYRVNPYGPVVDLCRALVPFLPAIAFTHGDRASLGMMLGDYLGKPVASERPDRPEPDSGAADAGLVDWLRCETDVVDVLPSLLRKLKRLGDLEQRFDATLQTEKLRSLAEFAAGAGHEVNNPLATIGGRAQLLLASEPSPERRRDLATIYAQTRRAHEMIADVRLFACPPALQLSETDLGQLVPTVAQGVLDQWLAGSDAQDLAPFSCDVGSGPLIADVDGTQMAVALGAVLRNALEATGTAGHIQIECGHREIRPGETSIDPDHRVAFPVVEITIRDDGPGMTAEERRHAFDPFYSARQAGRGLGFGLSKAWRIIDAHGGTIHLGAASDDGTVVTIWVPVARAT